MVKNASVLTAVHQAIADIDGFLSKALVVKTPSNPVREVLQLQLEHRSGSVRVASLFFLYYALVDRSWNWRDIPIGIRGPSGDKLLSEELSKRHVTLHNATVAFGENLGWKGDVRNRDLLGDKRFAAFAQLMAQSEAAALPEYARYVSYRFAESQVIPKLLPPIGDDALVFVKARSLFESLMALRSEGFVQQLLVAAVLEVHRRRFGFTIKTNHTHAADTFSGAAGDIEEYFGSQLVRAYEVTMRDDWKNRLSSIREKMDRAGLAKYVIFAAGVNSDDNLAQPANMMKFIHPYGRDIAVIDIRDFLIVFAGELTREELEDAVNRTQIMLHDRRLCGRQDIIELYREAVQDWHHAVTFGR